MEKFGMNFGGGPSRKELLETIETQKQQLLRFQARLKDVVHAYKSLLKEKEALEASLKVLSLSHHGELAVPPPAAGDSPDDRSSEHSEDSAGTAASTDTAAGLPRGDEEDKPAAAPSPRAEEPSGAEGGELCAAEPERRLQQLKAQLATLTGALATVTQEKSRMEASYQAERRQMKQELEEAAARARAEAGRQDAELQRLQEQLAQTRGCLAAQQREREREQGDHGLMLRELQELLRAERDARRAAEQELQQAREALAGGADAAERAQGHEQHARQLGLELEELRRELQGAREENGKADPRVQELQEEMAGLKNHFQLQLVQEMKKTAQAEEQLRQLSQREEQRVAELEAQVSQVSELLGTYEKAKQRDQGTIQRLKERIVQLDLENKTLAMAASSRSLGEVAVEEATLDVSVLKEKMEKLRKLLQAAAGKGPEAEEPQEPEPSPGSGDGNGDKAPGGHCQQELRQLKEEFERYKVRAQQVLKSKATKDVGLAKELEEAREQLAELQDKHVLLQLAADDTEKRHRQELEARKQELSQLQQLHRQELERCQLEFRERALRLEEEMHKQRDRALAVLAEKDRELEQLRALALPHGPKSCRDGGPGPGDAPSQDSSEILPQELQLCSGSEPTFFLYAEQLARKEVEIAALRKHKHRLEVQLHQLQGRALAEEDKHREEVAALRGEIQKNCRDKGREGANLEYLKNVVYRFLTLPDARGRQQTLTAILAILHFSPEEKLSIAKSSAHGSWWLHGKR
ncbi:GRIP and coiled-coil domain-containing protein 1 [Serinus canaria]|uniref:GRIP and coiled-coil domain-containing protein 1 n=1 Tax=Serinus canaria TaxID=9135 RepID=UPI0021CC7B75|nr:GRIP and coiled-coil domain-containing protein 1 [Serinus canaria]XP_050825768.1 GRIP and coiled-coil domain-containing protein 1 [Serinus canaria]XP_050825769.1 GRIP and coiled-coil domain-containing protein 1 [Serinus canaria]XP_050825770.1 GRIP and coiled-coil domain-containing protein 1 [Serinus canaria]XP_050825771.1 GRIP and coiled-coil domain-containing protein 1 [Serinus canaria]XP_050825772.1 GRIP and coiled-coil domain-containing protein 1 [Serinus canaria]XP_050825773.1 GRIP and